MTRFARLPWSREQRSDGTFKNRETSEVMEPIRELCRRLHLRCERNATGMARGFSSGHAIRLHSDGMWDLEVYDTQAGCSIMVECKMPGKGLEPLQAEWAKIYRACGKELIVATSAAQFLHELDAIRQRRRNCPAVKKTQGVDDGVRGENERAEA